MFRDILKLCSPVLFCSGLALFCKVLSLFRIQDGLSGCARFLQNKMLGLFTTEECRKPWGNGCCSCLCSRQDVCAAAADLCMSSWAWAYFTLAKVGISSSPAGISGQAEGVGGRTQTCCGQDEPWLRGQLKLLVHLWSEPHAMFIPVVVPCGAMWRLRSLLILQLTAS